MAWTYNTTVIREGRSWTNDDGIKHPTNWGSWSEQEKTEAGLVWVDDPAPFDSRFFWAAGVPKALEDVYEVDENGDPLLDEDGEQIVTPGLKTQWTTKVKSQAYGLLQDTDWYVIRNAESGAEIPSDVSDYRSAVRAYSDYLEGQVTAVTSFPEFVTLVSGDAETPSEFASWPEEA